MGREVRGAFRPALLFISLLLAGAGGCQMAPAPPEVELAEILDGDLRGAGAPLLASEAYVAHTATLAVAREVLAQERARFALLRDWDRVAAHYQAVVAAERALLAQVAEIRESRSRELGARIEAGRARVSLLRALTTHMNEGRLARRSLMRAELALDDAERSLQSGDFDGAEEAAGRSARLKSAAEQALAPVVCRYLDSGQVARWRRHADLAVAESARTGGLVFVVYKFERRMVAYRAGKAWRTYRVGIGMNGLSDKLYVGDKATPEGWYRVSRKLTQSKFYKALLIDYPNEEDRRRFVLARKRGLVPAGRGIGGNVEIHGGGKDCITEGCVSLDNPAMDEVFAAADVGTPVVIVGAVEVSVKDLLSAVCGKKTV